MRNVRRRRSVAAVGVTLVLAAVALGGSSAQAVDMETTSCKGVFSGLGDQPLTKAFVGATFSGGTATLTFTLTSGRPDGESRVRDCAFVDINRSGAFDKGEVLFGTDDKTAVFIGGTTTISITLNAAAGDRVCDRAARSGDAGGGDFTDKSNLLCVVLEEPTTTTTSHDGATPTTVSEPPPTTLHDPPTTLHG